MLYTVIVIGAGQAGLATAYALKDSGLNFLIVEAGPRATGSWPSYYNSLKLFSPARYSSLPGLDFPGDPHRYPMRDEVVSYLESYANHFKFPMRLNTHIKKIERQGRHFLLHTAEGEVLTTETVVVASGPFNQPNIPNFPGLSTFEGKVMHSSAYKSPEDVLGNQVAVIGAGNSAVQIAYELSATKQVTLVSREAPRFRKQRPLGIDIHAWLTYSGFDRLPIGQWLNWHARIPVLDQGDYRAAVSSGLLAHRELFDEVTQFGLRWANQVRHFDTILLATGFKAAPSFLDGLDGLDQFSAAKQQGGMATHVPGLYFVGVAWQRSHASATLRGVGADADYVVKRIKKYRTAIANS